MNVFSPKYPARFLPGERAMIVMGGYRGHFVKIVDVRPGWPYANYTVEHDVEGQFLLNERELGKHKETGDGAAATPAEREAQRIAQRRTDQSSYPPGLDPRAEEGGE